MGRHVVRMRKMRNSQRFLVGNPKATLYDNKTFLQEIRCKNVDWINQAHDRGQ